MATITPLDRAGRAGLREWLGLVVLALPTLLVALDINSVFLALPHLSADLGADAVQQLWIADGYGLMVAGFVVTMGTLGDRIGRRRLLMIGAAAFGLLSVASAYAADPAMLIAARLLLGVAGATLMPSTLGLISAMFTDTRQRGLAITAWSTCVFAGAALGPVLGGVLLTHYWWGSVFLIGAPTMAVLLVAAPLTLPDSRNPDAGRLDLVSVLLSLAAILPSRTASSSSARTCPTRRPPWPPPPSARFSPCCSSAASAACAIRCCASTSCATAPSARC
ncbi:MFS transporter [Catellatospora coxensis]